MENSNQIHKLNGTIRANGTYQGIAGNYTPYNPSSAMNELFDGSECGPKEIISQKTTPQDSN